MKRPAKLELAQLLRWWTTRPAREKLMLLGGFTVAALALTDALVTSPMDRALRQAKAQLASTQKQFEQLASQRSDDAERARQLREHEAVWRERLAQAQKNLDTARAQAAEASRLPETLRAVVGTVGNARLLELELRDATGAAPGTPVGVSGSDAASPAPGAGATPVVLNSAGAQLHRLPIVLKAAGSFEELQLLLRQIERHASALQWVAVQLDSSRWPEIELTLNAQVLSLEPRWGAGS